jgi:hypothetical protein
MTRPKGTMGMDLYRRILDEAATIPQIEQVTLTGLGEPMLDRYIVQKVAYAKSVMPPCTLIDLYTNGSYLRPKMTDALIAAGLSILYISVNANNAADHQAVMRLNDYDRVVEHAEYARQAAMLSGGSMKVVVKGVQSKDLMEAPMQFIERWGGDYRQVGGNGFLHLEGNWAGSVGAPMRVKPTAACARALGEIMVLWDGRVSLCCFDAHGDVILGDLNHQTLRDVFNGSAALSIREAHRDGRRSELQLCGTCTGI